MTKVLAASDGVLSLIGLPQFLEAEICPAPRWLRPKNVSAVAGWGVRESGLRAERLAKRFAVPVIHLEDGFLRSVFPGREFRPYSIVQDRDGIYYDSTRESSLESMLSGGGALLEEIASDVLRARQMIVQHHLSKYNHAPELHPSALRSDDKKRVLVIDQTVGDSSVTYGGADETTFHKMLTAAKNENPSATIYVKTHPEVSLGRKRGYLIDVQDDQQVVVLREPINPISLVKEMEHVYVVTSTMGFEALLAGRAVTCFGLPWYAGWGVTDDRQVCSRRMRQRSIDELFAAAYFHYTTYLNPRTGELGNIFDVIDWLIEQRAVLQAQATSRT